MTDNKSNKDGLFSRVAAAYRNHKKAMYYYVAGFSLLAVLAIGPAIVQAVLTLSAQQAQAIRQKNDAIETAILNNDYATWSSLVDDENLKSSINASNFPQFAEAYRLLQLGKVTEADIIKKSLSLKQDFVVASAKSKAIDEAIMGNDYTAWRNIVGSKAETQVNSGNFSEYAKAYRLIMSGKLKQAGYVKERVGIKIDTSRSSGR